MQIVQDAGTRALFPRDAISAVRGGGAHSAITNALSKAADVYISAKGKALSDADGAAAQLMTPAEAALHAQQKELDDKRTKKAQAAEIEQRIKTDAALTDEDKAKLQKQADELRRAGMTDEDKMNEAYEKIEGLEQLVRDGKATYKEVSEQILHYEKQASALNDIIAEKSKRYTALRTQAVQERAGIEAPAAKAEEKEAAPEGRADGTTLLSTLLKYMQSHPDEKAKGKATPEEAGVTLSLSGKA